MSDTDSTMSFTRTILLVEDNDNDEELTLRALEKAGMADRVVVTRDGVEALDYLFATGDHAGRDAGELPAVVILDLKLPKMDGLEMLGRLRDDRRTWLLPVVVLTSSDEERGRMESYRLGANSYVRKPVKYIEFVNAVQQLALYWLDLNEPPPEER